MLWISCPYIDEVIMQPLSSNDLKIKPKECRCVISDNLALLAKQSSHSLQHTVLIRIVRVILRRYLKQRREGGGVGLDPMPYPFRNLFTISVAL